MQLKPEEISRVIRSQIKYYENAIQQNETGTVLMVGDGIARASGLVNCMAGELLEFEDGSYCSVPVKILVKGRRLSGLVKLYRCQWARQ